MKKWLVMSVLALTACGGGSSGSGGKFTSGGSASKLVGIWDASKTYVVDIDGVDVEYEDVYYFAVDDKGYLSTYNYASDSFDDWGNCYWVEKDFAKLTALGNNQYKIQEVGIEGSSDLTITVTDDVMTVTGNFIATSSYFDNSYKDAEQYPKLNRSLSDLTPECVDSLENARALIPAKKVKSIVSPNAQ